MQIGSHRIDPPTALAPMAAVTNAPFRAVCRRNGCGLTVTEMVSAEALVRGASKTGLRMDRAPGEDVLVIQLFGSDPALMAEATRRAEEAGADVIDLNMGCPVRKINASGSGVALMREPGRAAAIVAAMARVARVPVTVKMRAGWDDASVNATDVARAVEGAGARAIAVHARTREQVHAGEARWDVIRAVKAAVAVPVIGNGGIRTVADALRLRADTGCDAVMIARGAQGNPWIFRGIAAGREAPPTLAERFATIREHLALYVAHVGESRAVVEMRKHLCWYVAELPGAAAFRARLHEADDLGTLQGLIDAFALEQAVRSARDGEDEAPWTDATAFAA